GLFRIALAPGPDPALLRALGRGASRPARLAREGPVRLHPDRADRGGWAGARAALRRSGARRHLRGGRPRALAVRGPVGGVARRRVLGPAAHDGRAPAALPVPA